MNVSTSLGARLLPVLLAITPACSAFAGSLQPVSIQATDPRAEIYVDGQHVGTGAATVELKRNRSHAFMAKAGDRTATATLGKSISTTGVLDIVGGVLFLVPFIGVVTPGFWELDSETVMLGLPPAPPRK